MPDAQSFRTRSREVRDQAKKRLGDVRTPLLGGLILLFLLRQAGEGEVA